MQALSILETLHHHLNPTSGCASCFRCHAEQVVLVLKVHTAVISVSLALFFTMSMCKIQRQDYGLGISLKRKCSKVANVFKWSNNPLKVKL